jgi:hypothetical protein
MQRAGAGSEQRINLDENLHHQGHGGAKGLASAPMRIEAMKKLCENTRSCAL